MATPAFYQGYSSIPVVAGPFLAHLKPALSPVQVSFRTGDSETQKEITVQLQRNYQFNQSNGLNILPGSCSFTYNGVRLKDNGLGKIQAMTSDGLSEEYGSINYSDKSVLITKSDSFAVTNLSLSVVSGSVTTSETLCSTLTFRTPGVPVVPGSLTFRVTDQEGNTVQATSDFSGNLISTYLKGSLNHENGTVILNFGSLVSNTAQAQSEDWYSEENVTADGLQVWKPVLIDPTTAIISCVVSSYMPLDPELLGLNPVRLPIDGKVPVFADGGIILIHCTKQTNVANLISGDLIDLQREDLASIEIYDSTGKYLPETNNYEYDLSEGLVTILPTISLTGFTAPFTVVHRVEDMKLANDVQVTGDIAVTSAITHDYLAEETQVSSVLPLGDKQARVYNLFSQQSWSGVWSNTPGTGILAKYDNVNYPIEIVNKTSIQERFAFILQSTSTVQIVGDHLGVIASGVSILADIELPYFTIRAGGWGLGWATGNVLRLNTAAANHPIWVVRTTLQGPATDPTDNFIIQIRGDAS